MKNLKSALSKQKWELIGSLFLLAVFTLPFLTFASSRKDIFVDASIPGIEDGSAEHPYRTISEALVHADDRTDVHVAKGIYQDNIEIPEGVKVLGSSAGDVVIRAKNSKKVVVSMKDDTEINKLTIEKGREGVFVKKDAEVSIIKCIIKDNDKNGVTIDKGSTKKKNPVSITDSIIKDNGRTGIFSQKRRLVLMDNEISDNDSDGVDLATGSSAWIEDNKFQDNDGSGMKLGLDGSDIWTKNNSFRDNKREGIEINAFGGKGRIDINKSKFSENKRYGIARVARGNFSSSVWNGLTVQKNTTLEMSKLGKISPIIRVN